MFLHTCCLGDQGAKIKARFADLLHVYMFQTPAEPCVTDVPVSAAPCLASGLASCLPAGFQRFRLELENCIYLYIACTYIYMCARANVSSI
jgi:hypothetical protein